MTNSSISQMIDALDLEIEAVRQAAIRSPFELYDGCRCGTAVGHTLYRFPLIIDIRVADETPMRLECGQGNVDGFIVSVDEAFLTVAIQRDLGPAIPRARVVRDETFLLERLQSRLAQIRDGGMRFNRTAADRVMGEACIRSGGRIPAPETLPSGAAVNREQQEAVSRASGSDTIFLWGPPGTGKTMTLACIVDAQVRAGSSVLLVSNTNIAVDTALEKIAERLEAEPWFHKGAVLRYGPLVKQDLRDRFGDQVDFDQVLLRLGAVNTQQQLTLKEALASHMAEARRLQVALDTHYEGTRSRRRDLARQREAAAIAEAKMATSQEEMNRIGAERERLNRELLRAREMGRVRRWLARLDPDRIARQLAVVVTEHATADDIFRATSAETEAAREAVLASERQLASSASMLAGLPPAADSRMRLATIEREMQQLTEQIARLNALLQQMRAQLLRDCRVLATTVYRTYLNPELARQFDVVVIDEASMLALPLAFYSAGLASKSVVVAGDFRQLPPVVISEEPLAIEWLRRDAFDKAGIPAMIGSSPEYLVALKVQYRMHEQICECVNEIFYRDHPLISDPIVHSRAEREFPLGKEALLYVDTASQGPWASARSGSSSRYNFIHALLVSRVVAFLKDSQYLPRSPEESVPLGIVSPYAAQTGLIKTLVKGSLGKGYASMVSTVHRFQGNEKESMLIDLTDSDGYRIGRFMNAVQPEDVGARLLNVAISRARSHVVLIANFRFLEENAPSGGVTHRFLKYFREHGSCIAIERYLDFGHMIQADGRMPDAPGRTTLPNTPRAFNEQTFFQAFGADVLKASRSIVVYSPFLKTQRLEWFTQAVQSPLSRGVIVRFFTRPETEPWQRRELECLAALGVEIVRRPEMHEKIAIIDSEILWHGSLNITQHGKSTDSMLRLEDRALCGEVGRLVALPGRTRPALGRPR